MAERFVLDCSVAAKWVLADEAGVPAWQWYERYTAGEVEFIAPDLILTEFASLISKRCRRKEVTKGQARDALRLFRINAPRLVESPPLLDAALELSIRHEISLWDAVYVALALELGCACLTADRRLFRGGGAGRHAVLKLVE